MARREKWRLERPDAASRSGRRRGLAGRGWIREIDNASRFSRGYEEGWFSLLYAAGCRIAFPEEGAQVWYAMGKVLFPVVSRVEYNLDLAYFEC